MVRARPWLLVSCAALLVASLARTQGDEKIGTLPLAEVARAFAALEEASARDDGALWGVEVAGPVLIVDPLTRRVAANQADAGGELVAEGPPESVAQVAASYTGKYLREFLKDGRDSERVVPRRARG